MFCGSRFGAEEGWARVAEDVGRRLALRGYGVVYGGSALGLMGTLASAALAAGGRVVGVLPHRLVDREVALAGLTALEVVGTLAERKRRMLALSDRFLVLPGGIGTLDEFFEVWTMGQLEGPSRPIGILNVQGFYDPLVGLLDHLQLSGFLDAEARTAVDVIDGVDALEAWL